MRDYHQIAARLFNTALAVDASRAVPMLMALAPRFGIAHIVGPGGEVYDVSPAGAAAAPAQDASLGNDASDSRPYEVDEGIAIFRIHGSLVQRSSWITTLCGLTSYEALCDAFIQAVSDPHVRGIFLEIDSPGGEVAGLFDLVDVMMAVKGAKPVHAHANELAASAAYAIAAVADHLSTPRTGLVGSVGVIAIHAEFSEALAQDGITVTVLRAGARKTEANPYETLTDAAEDWFQTHLEATRTIFVGAVARGRGIDAAVVTDSEAALLTSAEALANGFIDDVMSLDEAARHLLDTVGNI